MPEKLDEERQALGGHGFDRLGRVAFGNRSLRDVLIEAVEDGAALPVWRSFRCELDFGVTSLNYKLAEMLARASDPT